MRGGRTRGARGAGAIVVAGAALLLTGPTHAQQTGAFFPDQQLLPRLLGGPLEPTTAVRLVFPTSSPTLFGNIVEGETAVGTTLAVLRLDAGDDSDAVLVGVGGGVVARFNMETEERDLISSDWTFVLPLVIRRDGHWLRMRYFHSSAHMGDEYLERFDTTRVRHARDAAEALVFLNVGRGVGLYGGGRWAFRVDPPEHARLALRAGVELQPPVGSTRPFLVVDIESDQQNDWTPRLDARLGLWLTPHATWPGVRIELGFLHGPPFQGQFAEGRTTSFSIGAAVDL